MQRLPCARCGDSIHPDTASRNGGLCVPCVRGNLLSIEERKRHSQEARRTREAFYAAPEYKYWQTLVGKVYGKESAFNDLSPAERLYYLVNVFGGELHNGGFDQFFTNTSGARYRETVAALEEVGAQKSLALLLQAKTILFSNGEVPVDRAVRCSLMPTWDESHPDHDAAHEALDALDKRFYADPDELEQVLDGLAKRHGLYETDA